MTGLRIYSRIGLVVLLLTGFIMGGCSSSQPRESEQPRVYSRSAHTNSDYVQQRHQVRRNSNYTPSRAVARQHSYPNATPERLTYAALDRLRHHVVYDGRYIPIRYPNGDVPSSIGVCTDTVIRSYRRLGIDLQSLVHEDMEQNFYCYPNLPKWGLTGPDPNIDHRRVPNLKTFFTRHGARVPVTRNPNDYQPGDLVTWNLGGDQEHIGIVVDRVSTADPSRHMVVHNIGEGEKIEDVLFQMPISGHYRYFPR
jgi:hypothetical protein